MTKIQMETDKKLNNELWSLRREGVKAIIRRGRIVVLNEQSNEINQERDICPLKVLCMNAGSIVNKIPELHLIIKKENPEIIGITESWLSDDIDNKTLALNGYTIFRADRNDGSDPHGGVLLAVKSCFNPILVSKSSDFETILAKIRIRNNDYNIIICYRTTAMDTAKNKMFVDYLRDNLRTINNCILMGDYNYPGIN